MNGQVITAKGAETTRRKRTQPRIKRISRIKTEGWITERLSGPAITTTSPADRHEAALFSIRKSCTRSPWELIVINNGSTDGTGVYLAGVQDAAPVPVTVIANSTNFGFPAAINQGLKYARGEYLVLLNNDAVVTEGWLEQLIGLSGVVPGSAEPRDVPDSRGQTDCGDSSGARESEPNAEARG